MVFDIRCTFLACTPSSRRPIPNLQLMMRKSISLPLMLVLSSTLCTTSKITISASVLAASTERSAGVSVFSRHLIIPGGHAVACPVPDLYNTHQITREADRGEGMKNMTVGVQPCTSKNRHTDNHRSNFQVTCWLSKYFPMFK